MKKPVFTDPSVEAPFIKMNYESQFDRILRKPDRNNVYAIFDLLNMNGLETYLSGGVVQRLIDSRHKDSGDYQDIDLLGVYEDEEEGLGMLKFLNKNEELMLFDERSTFKVKHDVDSNTPYFNLNGLERFKLTPIDHPFPLSLFKSLKQSQIDLGLIQKDVLKENISKYGMLNPSPFLKTYFNLYDNFYNPTPKTSVIDFSPRGRK